MGFSLQVALRFLKEGRLQTILILVGISVGIAVQVFLSSLITGLQKDLIQKTVGTSPHIVGTRAESLPIDLPAQGPVRAVTGSDSQRPIRRWQPLVDSLEQGGGFTVVSAVVHSPAFASQGEQTYSILVRGVDPERDDRIYGYGRRLVDGRLDLGGNRVLVGQELARKLRLRPGVAFRIVSAAGVQDLFTVAATFDLENENLNTSWVMMDRERAQSLFRLEGGVTAIDLQVADVFAAERQSRRLRESIPDLRWESWQKTNANLLAALQSQSGSSMLIQALVILAVMLGISSVLAVSAVQKTRQIGILKALGTTTRSILGIFLIQGGILGCGGALLGSLLGLGIIRMFVVSTAAATGRPLFPIAVAPSLVLLSVAVATFAGTAAAVLPARRAARLQPIEVIRNG